MDGWGFKTLDGLNTTPVYESDDELRARVWYVAADGERLQRDIVQTQGPHLDELAGNYGLSRRRIS